MGISLRIILVALFLPIVLGSCGGVEKKSFDERYGKSAPVERISLRGDAALYQQASQVIEQRCVVCHACYDAPCQQQLGSIEGIDRGASQTKVYDGYRLLEGAPTRLYVDGKNTTVWREKGFFPVLNERQATPENNLQLSLLYQLLDLKKANPLPEGPLLPPEVDISLNRAEKCPRIDHFEEFRVKHPQWGMPYGLPPISEEEFNSVKQWLEQGALAPERQPLPEPVLQMVRKWEAFFNADDVKSQLVSRYLYEHLYLAHLYFDEVDSSTFFTLVRSSTPPGEPVQIIASRRPYDYPGVARVYYRLQPVLSTIVAKNHMPYALNARRYQYWHDLFFGVEYEVTTLPGYDIKDSSNPFVVFSEIPIRSRYMFLLDEAKYSIENFIKGPVCRGQIALDVIDDHFWVAFVHPDIAELEMEEEFILSNIDLLRFPAYWDSNGSIMAWRDLSARHQKYTHEKELFMQRLAGDEPVGLETIWDGYGFNENAALTVFRHGDSATVMKGFAGEVPKTAWIIDYSLLERIHYLLVAGFDVHGNVLHQLTTRLYMDFLRMEGEANFIELLPEKDRRKTWQSWYREAEPEVSDYFDAIFDELTVESGIGFQQEDTRKELMLLLADITMGKRGAIPASYPNSVRQLDLLNRVSGRSVSFLPEVAVLEVVDGEQSWYLTLIHHEARKNLTHLFRGDVTRTPDFDTLTVMPGVAVAYPNAFLRIEANRIPDFIRQVEELSSEEDYFALMTQYGIRRTSKNFWSYSDRLHRYFREAADVEYGLLDYNRLENR
jgi:hypothetical protein